MQVIFVLVSQVNPSVLQSLFLSFSKRFAEIDWKQQPELLSASIQRVIDILSPDVRSKVSDTLCRLYKMTDSYSHQILVQWSKNPTLSTELRSSLERCCLMFMEEPATFKQAEKITCSRNNQVVNKPWSHYLLVDDCNKLSLNDLKIDAFTLLLQKILGDGARVNARAIQRRVSYEVDKSYTETCLVIHYSRLSEHYASFDESLVAEAKQLALQSWIIYSDKENRVEVSTENEGLNSIFAHAFASCFLGSSHVVEEQFVLSEIVKSPSLLFEKNSGIKQAVVTRVKFQESEWNSYLEIDYPLVSDKQCDLLSFTEQRFNTSTPINSKLFEPVEITIYIRTCNEGKGDKLFLTLALPNFSTLRNFSDDDRTILTSHLKKWGVTK